MSIVTLCRFTLKAADPSSINQTFPSITALLKANSEVQKFLICTDKDNHNAMDILVQSSEPLDLSTELESIFSPLSTGPPTIMTLRPSHSSFKLPIAPILELALSTFPAPDASELTNLHEKIEFDFERFCSIFNREASGGLGCVYGWIDGDAMERFLVIRGWQSHEMFEQSCATKSFGEAKGILFGWGAEFRMWFDETRRGDEE